MRYSWWSGRLSFGSSTAVSPHEHNQNARLKVALVVGITDMVGISLSKMLTSSDAPGGPWKVYGVTRSLHAIWPDESPINLIRCNLLEPTDVTTKIAPLHDVTHLFWVICMHTPIKQDKHTHSGIAMFENLLNTLVTHAPHLQHICLQTSDKHYVGPTGTPYMREPPFREAMPWLHALNVYHTLEDILFDAVEKRDGITWSVHRPSIILGFSPWNFTNLLGGLAVYAAICKHEGVPFQYPGNVITWERFVDAADANLIAEQEVWACIEPSGKNQAFNISNGDVFSFKIIWSVLADKFGLQVPQYKGEAVSLQGMMKGKDDVWDEIVMKHGLLCSKLSEVACWWYVDSVLNMPFSSVLDMNKSKELGFVSFRNTEASVLHWIHEMRQRKVIP